MKDSEKGEYTSPDGSATWEYIGVISCAGLMLCSGCIAGWNAPALAILMGPNSPIPLTSSEASTLTAMSTIGHTVATTFILVMTDKLGRKKSLLVSSIPLLGTWAMIALSREVGVLYSARFVAGVSFGLNICIPPMYLGEIASANLRGLVGMVCGVMMSIGSLFMFTIAPYLSMKMTASICFGIATVTTISIWFIPESPYFLAMAEKIDEAEEALEKLRGKTDVGEELELIKMTIKRTGNVEQELESNENEVDEVSNKPSALRQLFTVSGNRKALAINFLFTIAIQLGGCVCIMTYGSTIFSKMNTGVTSDICTMIIGIIQLISTILVMLVIEKVGRKPLLRISGLVSSCSVLIVGVYFFLMEYMKMDVTPYGLFALCAIFLEMIAINIGIVPLQMVIQSEILGTDVKSLATFFIGIGGGVISTIGAKGYLTIAETWGCGHSVPFLGFAAITWFSTVLILKWLPETKGKTLLDIQRDLNA